MNIYLCFLLFFLLFNGKFNNINCCIYATSSPSSSASFLINKKKKADGSRGKRDKMSSFQSIVRMSRRPTHNFTLLSSFSILSRSFINPQKFAILYEIVMDLIFFNIKLSMPSYLLSRILFHPS